jgi:glycosyltransferase involved in cell wall biosynthesis
MNTGFILDGDFVNDPRVVNEALILAGEGHTVYVLNRPEKEVPSYKEFGKGIYLLMFAVSKRLHNYLFALENLVPIYDLLWYRKIKNLVKEYEIEVLHAHDLYMARAAGWAARDFNIPLVLDLHENYPAAVKEYRWANRFPAKVIVRPGKWKKKEREYLLYADKIIVLSSDFKNTILSEYPEINADKLLIYPNVPDIRKLLSYKIDSEIFPLKDKQVIFYFGVISRRRGILTAIKAMEAALKVHPALHLLLIGPIDKAEKDDFMSIFKKESLRDNITYYPWKDISEFPSFVKCSSVCISPVLKNAQHESGVANKVFQYMLFGKPLLVSDCAPQSEIIRKTGCGLSFKSGNAGDMALKLSELISDPEKCREMGERGKKAVEKEYNTEVQGRAIINAYTGLKAGKC